WFLGPPLRSMGPPITLPIPTSTTGPAIGMTTATEPGLVNAKHGSRAPAAPAAGALLFGPPFTSMRLLSLARSIRWQLATSTLATPPSWIRSGITTVVLSFEIRLELWFRSEERRVGKECRCRWWSDH